MILERKMQLNIPDLKKQVGELQSDALVDAAGDRAQAAILELSSLMQVYNGAMKGISTKLEVLDDEFHIQHSHNPIHHLECRIKGVRSIYEKMQRRGFPFTTQSVRDNIQDIAGIRVICNFLDDIYVMEKLLLQQADVTLLQRKDYIQNPKENGYRSLHLVVMIPVFLSNKTENVPVEIQMRTVAMDYWASLEHMLRYKNDKDDMEQYYVELQKCANTLAETEKTMQKIFSSIAD